MRGVEWDELMEGLISEDSSLVSIGTIVRLITMPPPQEQAEEELEKQYRDYKIQFEEWKEKNKNATTTDAYKAYVKQFETWEKDVTKRRRVIQDKKRLQADHEAELERMRNAREEQAREEMHRQQKEDEMQRQAAQAYADQQASYMSHHVAAMEAESRKMGKAPQPLMAQIMSAPVGMGGITGGSGADLSSSVIGETNADSVMAEMMSIVMGGATAALGGVDAPVVGQAPPQLHPLMAAPPKLWGNVKKTYDAKDSLFSKWGPRAAPAHCYVPPPPQVSATPCWLLIEETSKRKMMLTPQGAPVPPPGIQPTIRSVAPSVIGKMPSISAILGVTSDKVALKRWQQMMIKNMGIAGFRKWMGARVSSGTKFHSAMERLAKDAVDGKLNESNESILNEVEGSARGYVQSALPILRSFGMKRGMDGLFERSLVHPTLLYQGRFDAVLPLKEGMVIIDWKTSSANSSIGKNMQNGENSLDKLYSYPSQMAAYVGAFNASIEFDRYPQIDRAYIVVAHENGQEGNLVEMSGDELEMAWIDWKNRVNSFWKSVNESDDKGMSTVDLRY
uniref:PDDEXK_1 domain-containing protein n=1 Tax=Pristionchus pacificus TaxID=54126 RepID=A0A2A6CT86_PRIPA|eukprot:PDM81296.1 hypothetical protein PRIPAC_36299 [Pristionchus pacificus]